MALVDNLEAMLARGPDNALLRYGLGGEYLKLNQSDRAIEHLRRALELDPRYSAAWKLLGQAQVAAGRNDEAMAAYAEGVRVADEKGDVQAGKEMRVFLKRLSKT